jgi:hypothetical protein
MMKMKMNKQLGTVDLETDPFAFNAKIEPFALGFKTEFEYREYWGDECIQKWLSDLDPDVEQIVYAHNGGKFDFIFFIRLNLLENPIKIINGRIVSAMLKGTQTELRDSFAIFPFALSQYRKDDIDYQKMERKVRNKHKREILDYLKTDCLSLFELVTGFWERFGNKLTVGGASMSELRKHYPFERANATHDATFREFYFGGRCEYFERGVLPGKWKVFDVNSQYPAAMVNFDHPTGLKYIREGSPRIGKGGDLVKYPGKMYFARIECRSAGALPVRAENGGLSFPHIHGEFFACSHEIKAGLELGLISKLKLIECLIPCETTRFDKFILGMYAERDAAREAGNEVLRLAIKFVMNSSYGKFAQNPDSFRDFIIVDCSDPPLGLVAGGWELDSNFDDFEIWAKPNSTPQYYDVATAASITSAARSVLLRGLANSVRPVYCDTDSIICEDFNGEISNSKLGAWKFEMKGNSIAIAGKKLYALFNRSECVKFASKGVRLNGDQIRQIARGGSINWDSPAPTMNFRGEFKYISRNIKMKG